MVRILTAEVIGETSITLLIAAVINMYSYLISFKRYFLSVEKIKALI
jgi:hypothetical protein